MQNSRLRANAPTRFQLPTVRKVVWATRSFIGRLGVYTGVAYDNGHLYVAVLMSSGHPRWVLATDALTHAEADAWAHSGFARKA